MSRKAGHEPPAVINTELKRRGDVAGVSRAAVCATAREDEEEEEQRQGDVDEVEEEEQQQKKGTTYRISATNLDFSAHYRAGYQQHLKEFYFEMPR